MCSYCCFERKRHSQLADPVISCLDYSHRHQSCFLRLRSSHPGPRTPHLTSEHGSSSMSHSRDSWEGRSRALGRTEGEEARVGRRGPPSVTLRCVRSGKEKSLSMSFLICNPGRELTNHRPLAHLERVSGKSLTLGSQWYDWDDRELTTSPDTRFSLGISPWRHSTLGPLIFFPRLSPLHRPDSCSQGSLGAPTGCYRSCVYPSQAPSRAKHQQRLVLTHQALGGLRDHEFQSHAHPFPAV